MKLDVIIDCSYRLLDNDSLLQVAIFATARGENAAPNEGGHMETIYVVQGFKAGKRGALQAMPAVRAATEEQARGRAERLAQSCAGVIAFAQTADAEKGEYEEPVVLARHGSVPDLD